MKTQPIDFRAWDKHTEKMWKWNQHNAFTTDTGSIKQWFDDSDLFIMQFTNVLDSKGKKIYQGDICNIKIKVASKVLEYTVVIGWLKNGGFEFICNESDLLACDRHIWGFWDMEKDDEITVIGDIFRNWKLVEFTYPEEENWAKTGELKYNQDKGGVKP